MNRTARILAVVLAVVLVGVGVAVAYNVGFDSGAVAAAGERGTHVVIDRGYGRGGYGFFPLFPFLFPFLFVFLIFAIFRPRRYWGAPGHGWGSPPDMIDQRLTEWHRKAHGEAGSPATE